MQGFDPQTILPRIAAQGLERQEIRPGDWFDDDGMLMCGKCGEPRQGMVTVSAPMEGNPENKMTFKATRSCKCDRDKEAAEKRQTEQKGHGACCPSEKGEPLGGKSSARHPSTASKSRSTTPEI